MATAFRTAGFAAAWDALDGNISGLTLYDYVPGEETGTPEANKPYAVLEGNDTAPFDHDGKVGVYLEMTFTCLSAKLGRSEMDTILDSAYALLHRQTLTASGYTVVDTQVYQTQGFVLEDGKTRMGVLRFRITIQEV